MRKYLMIAVLALTSANLALADAACDAKAAEKNCPAPPRPAS